MTPRQAIDRLASFVEVLAGETSDYPRPELEEAVNVLDKFVTEVNTDLEWGDPGDCQYRLENDPDIEDELGEYRFSEAYGERLARATTIGLGRHYGLPHCIWCLEAT